MDKYFAIAILFLMGIVFLSVVIRQAVRWFRGGAIEIDTSDFTEEEVRRMR